MGLPYGTRQQRHLRSCPAEHFTENQATRDPSVLAQHTRYFSVFELTLFGTSLVVQETRIRLPMQETQVRCLAREDSTCLGATKPTHPRALGS